MSRDDYLTILEPGYAQTRVLGSRFLATAMPVTHEEEIEQHLAAERKRYHDATHWCFAARFAPETVTVERASDAGEPKGTAGMPILRELQCRELFDSLVIVTRYFGGTKLGTGNLARAYAECAGQALDSAVITRRRILSHLVVQCPYDLQAVIYHVAQKFQAIVEPAPSESQAAFQLAVPVSLATHLSAALTEESRGRIQIRVENS